MRVARIKVPSWYRAATYHCMSRTTGGTRWFKEDEKRFIQQTVWAVADFCGVIVLTYALMENHPHLLIRVPWLLTPPDDAELLRRYRVLHPRLTKAQATRLEAIEAHLKAGSPEGDAWRRRQLAQMGDISQFMKILKQRITAWFNRRHRRYGTIWAERFKSVLVEENSAALVPMATYIDLNPIRAGLVSDPKDYRYSGYAEAVAGREVARQGIMGLMEANSWDQAQAAYRLLLFGVGAKPRAKGLAIPVEAFEAVAAKGGRLTLAEALACRIRHFTDGAVLGSTQFVTEQAAAFAQQLGRKRRPLPRPLPPITDWGGLTTLRGRRGPPAG